MLGFPALKPPSPRLTLDELYQFYPNAEEALAAGDYGWVCRFARSDPLAVAEALVLLGNPVGALRLFDRCKATPRSAWLRIWAQHQLGFVKESAAGLASLEKECDRSRWTDILRGHLNAGPMKVLMVSNPSPERARIWTTVPDIEIKTMRFVGGSADYILDPTRPIAEAIGGARFDLVVLDTLHALPAGLAELDTPIVAFVADIEWNYAAHPSAYEAIDAVFAASSQVHMEMSQRFALPTFVYPFWSYYAFLDVDTGLVRQNERPIDVFYSGRVRHARGLYPEKPWWLYPILTLPESRNVVLDEGFLDPGDYAAAMGRSKFVPVVVRHANATSWRAVEALSCGAFLLHDETSLAPHIWSQDYHCCHRMDGSSPDADLLLHLDRYPTYRERFSETVVPFLDELRSLNPGPMAGTERILRHAALMAEVARIGFPDHQLRTKGGACASRTRSPASRRVGGGATAPTATDALIHADFLFLGGGPRKAAQQLRVLAKRASAERGYEGAVYHLSLYHQARNISSFGWEAALELADRYADRFPESGLFAYLHALSCVEPNNPVIARERFVALERTINAKTFAPVDGLLVWHDGLFKPFNFTDAIMRDLLNLRNGQSGSWSHARTALRSHCATYLAKIAFDTGDFNACRVHAAEAVSLLPSNVVAASLWLDAWFFGKENGNAEEIERRLVDNLVYGNVELFHIFAPSLAQAELKSGSTDRARLTIRLWFVLHRRWRQGGVPKAISEAARLALEALAQSGAFPELAPDLLALLRSSPSPRFG